MEINEKKLKEVLKEQKEEYQKEGQRYLKMLSEDSDSKFKLISEQYHIIQEILDYHTKLYNSIGKTKVIVR